MDTTANNESAYWFEKGRSDFAAGPLSSPQKDDSSASDKPTDLPSQLFTVRIWPEITEQGAITWRGKVQQVPNGAWRYFQEWQALTTFLQTQVVEGATAPPLPPVHSAGSLSG